MNSTRAFLGILALLALCLPGEAGLLDHFKKKDNCDEAGQPICSTIDSRPQIERPCCEIVRTYQRAFAQAPVSCDSCTTGPSAQPCWPAPSESCDLNTGCSGTCDAELAALILDSKTACYARQRRHAVIKMGNRFNCKSHPQLMPALVYAMNDADECVRAAATDKVGDQLRNNPCCCAPYIICALKLSLSDCDHHVRVQAEQALIACGYVVASNKSGTACGDACAPGSLPAAIPAAPQQIAPEPPFTPPAPGSAPAQGPAASVDQFRSAAVPGMPPAPLPGIGAPEQITAPRSQVTPLFMEPIVGRPIDSVSR